MPSAPAQLQAPPAADCAVALEAVVLEVRAGLPVAGCDGLRDLGINPAIPIVNVDLHTEALRRKNVGLYYSICRQAADLHVTTSCFAVWRKSGRKNGSGKVIPAARNVECKEGKEESVCVFFFDDNLEWDGCEDSRGICNLREVTTGDFVNFHEGANGFRRDTIARHTVVQHSSEYRVVLVKVNILDALEDAHYFGKIVDGYARPGEKVIAFMDVNSTIMCNDTSAGKDVRASMLSIMFELIEVRPHESFDLNWESYPSLRIEKPRSLKQLVKDLVADDPMHYAAFWKEKTCLRFIAALLVHGKVQWMSDAGPVTPASFAQQFAECHSKVSDDLLRHGIAASWFNCFQQLQAGGHAVILNSFGVDTRKVVLATVPDERRVMQITVNYEQWDNRDTTKFESQFRGQMPQALPPKAERSFFDYIFGTVPCSGRVCACN